MIKFTSNVTVPNFIFAYTKRTILLKYKNLDTDLKILLLNYNKN